MKLGINSRGIETEEQIQKQLRNAEAEIKARKSSGIFGHILYNENLEECYKNLKNVLGIDDDAPVNGVEVKEVEGINLSKEHTVTKLEDTILIQETGEGTKKKTYTFHMLANCSSKSLCQWKLCHGCLLNI